VVAIIAAAHDMEKQIELGGGGNVVERLHARDYQCCADVNSALKYDT
jgi:hypothetical protein